jgi:hypothetical protein
MTQNDLESSLHNNKEEENGRYLELLVHNVSHTDLVLSLAYAAITATTPSKNIETVLTTEHPHDSMDPNTNPQQQHPQQSPLHNNYSTERTNSAEREDPVVLCRPRFSAFDLFSRRVLEALTTTLNDDATVTEDGTSSSGMKQQQQQQAHDIISFPRYKRSDATQRYNIVTPHPHKRGMLPVGLKLSSNDSHDPYNFSRLQLSSNDLASLRLRGRDVPKLSLLSHTTHNNNNHHHQQQQEQQQQ